MKVGDKVRIHPSIFGKEPGLYCRQEGIGEIISIGSRLDTPCVNVKFSIHDSFYYYISELVLAEETEESKKIKEETENFTF